MGAYLCARIWARIRVLPSSVCNVRLWPAPQLVRDPHLAAGIRNVSGKRCTCALQRQANLQLRQVHGASDYLVPPAPAVSRSQCQQQALTCSPNSALVRCRHLKVVGNQALQLQCWVLISPNSIQVHSLPLHGHSRLPGSL